MPDSGAWEESDPKTLDSAPATVDPQYDAAVMQLLEQMSSDAAIERRSASDALDRSGTAAMPSIVQGLRGGSITQRRGAATYLIGRVTPRDVDAVGALIEALAAEDEVLRRAALQAVEKLLPEQLGAALPALVAYAQNHVEAEVYRSRALRAIAKLGVSAQPVAPELIRLASEDESLNVRRACYSALVKVAPAEVAERFYRSQLQQNPVADLRRLAAKWLPSVLHSEETLACLVEALRDEDKEVRLEAVNALVAVGKPTLPLLIAALESPHVETRRHAVLAVGKLGLLAGDAVVPLQKRLEDPDAQVRELATAALSVLQP